MKNKNNLFKNIFLVFFAFCFLGAGVFSLSQKDENVAQAEDTSFSQEISNDVPDYFSVKDTIGSTDNPSSLISQNTFLYYTEGGNSTELELSLAMNGRNVAGSTNEIYNYVYYPDKENTSIFYFYNIGAISLYYNGEAISLDNKNFVEDCGGHSFQNNIAPLQGFKMLFNNSGSLENEIGLLNENGEVNEGLYTLTLTITLYTCTDGGISASEEKFSDRNVNITYSFYVVDREKYIINNRPNISRFSFDHEVPVSDTTSLTYAYYLYYNYSSEGSTSNNIPYLEFDYTRFELIIDKELSNTTSSQIILFDKDSDDVISAGDGIVEAISDTDSKLCKVFFYDVGNYSVTFRTIQVVNFTNSNGSVTLEKNNLTAVSGITKKFMIYVYGYQANYTDIDGVVDENKVRPIEELKDSNFELGTYSDSADITSEFLNSNTNYSQANATESFLIKNILNFIENSNKKAVKTNQTPIKLTSNASLSTSISGYIYSTTKVSSSYSTTNITLNNDKSVTLYRTSFVGRTESTAGTYIYIIPYTFSNYYSKETTLAANTIFFQVFYFEVVKDLPTIKLETEKVEEDDVISEVYSNTYVNKNVKVTDLTKQDPYNKDVTIRIYAQDFNDNYLSSYGGKNGVTFENLPATGQDDIRILEDNAHYTIRMYFSNEMISSGSNANISIDFDSGFFREQKFTIDKTPIGNIQATNVSSITNSTNYAVVSNLNGVSTNQNIAISWDEKLSGAQTFAYYRYFAISNGQFYSKTDMSSVSNTIERMLSLSEDASYLPVNAFLDMSTSSNIWLKYKGNSQSYLQSGIISSEYVFTEAGLYLVDVYDEAGNHSVELYIIDYTTPIFAIYEDSFKIVSTSVYISKASTLFWGNYKGIYIQNLFSQDLFANGSPDSIDEKTDLTDELFKTYDKKASKEIYDVIYNKLVASNFMQQLICRTSTTGSDLTSYSGMYLTVPINSLSYYIDGTHTSYTPQSGVYSKQFDISEELTYRILIRDASNTKLQAGFDDTAVTQYTNFYSATQTIIISFDSSEFMITYTKSDNTTDILSSNIVEEGYYNDGTAVDESKRTKTTYLSPTKLNKEFILSFYPTTTDGDITIQVGSVSIKYYPYKEGKQVVSETDEDGNITKSTTYHYYELSDDSTTTKIYEYNGDNASTELKVESIRLNSENFTTAGRYEITRTYYVDETDQSKEYYNKNDFYERTFVFTVDRNEVITNPDLVTNENGSHLESLVGGDVFVSMYDNKVNAELVVTFPNSPEGNTAGSSLYNNDNPRTILTTNMLPVSVYVPQYKYTTYAQMHSTASGYDYDVNYNFKTETTTNPTTGEEESVAKDTMNNFKEGLLIREYAVYAEIYKDVSLESIKANGATPYARTATNGTGQLESVVSNENGFLNFYTLNGTKLDYLSQEGVYYVKIYQGNFGTEIGENNFSQSIIFCFEIKKSSPDFVAQSTTGNTLESVVVNSVENYYTNQPIINLSWQAGSDYMAEIDIDEITFKTSKRSVPFKSSDDIWTQEPTLTNNTYIAQLNLELLDIYENNAYVDITMQYKNHDDRFYTKVTKRVNVDLAAPSTNVQNLVANATGSGLISALSNSALRTYKTALGETTTNLNNTSYNISNSSGTFAYYSYFVTQDYANTLKQSIDFATYVAKFVNSNGECTKYNSNYEQEVSPDNFHASNFIDISKPQYFSGFDANSYYQVIETDRAGNMSIYTIYVTSYDLSEDEEENSLISYSYYDEDNDKRVDTSYSKTDYKETTSNGAIHNIYSKTSFQLSSINYFGDVWAQFKLDTYSVSGTRTTRYLMLTPWDPTYAYAFIGGNVTKLEISQLIDSSLSTRYKNCLSFYNRENQSTDAFYINIRNVSLTATLTDSQNREYIRFVQPSDNLLNSTTSPQTFVTSVTITANNSLIFDATNRLGLSSIWKSKQNANVTVTTDTTFGYLTFEINSSLGFTPNTRIVYEYTDNYGTKYKEIHLYKETIISSEISSENDLYAYYNTNGTLYYITKDGFEYFYNPNKYVVNVYDVVDGKKLDACNNADVSAYLGTNGITTVTIKSNDDTGSYNDCFAVEVRDFNDPTNLVKTIYVVLYNELPTPNVSTTNSGTGENNKPGEFKLLDASRNNVTGAIKTIDSPDSSDNTGYFSEITLLYSSKETFLPIKYSVSTDKQNWTEVSSGTVLKNTTDEMLTYYLKVWYDEQNKQNELSNSNYLFEYVPDSQIYKFNLSSLTSTFWVEKTVNNITTVVEKSNTIYAVRDTSGKVIAQYSNHYIVNVDYYTGKDAVQIKTNIEQKILPTEITAYENNGIVSVLWSISNSGEELGNIPAFNTSIVISYIPNSENFVDEFFTYSNTNGIINNTENSENLISVTSKKFVVSQDYAQLNRIELKWTKYYGIEQNEILIKLVKDGINLNPTVYSKVENNKSYNYIYLSNSGKYTISLSDVSGNVQKFHYGYTGQSDTLTFIFLKDVPFTVTSTDPLTGTEITTAPIKQAVYNDKVVLSIDKATRSEFYSTGGYPTITITKNGTALSNDTITEKNIIQDYGGKINYVFTESGYYEVYFTATSDDSNIGKIRQETYQFTVLSANEYKYSYIINNYSNYYIERVEKDGKDITATLLKTLNVSTLTIGNKPYMTELPLSYLDEKTGAGRYLITVNSNDNSYKSSEVITKWTFEVTIQVGVAPLSISVAEGKSTTKKVNITFNRANIFEEMGECTIRILKYNDKGEYKTTYYSSQISSDASGESTVTIEGSDDGVFYMQIVSPSGNLLYSYKIVKKEPMNSASIIIIVVAVVLALVIIFIIIKLRKRISVK